MKRKPQKLQKKSIGSCLHESGVGKVLQPSPEARTKDGYIQIYKKSSYIKPKVSHAKCKNKRLSSVNLQISVLLTHQASLEVSGPQAWLLSGVPGMPWPHSQRF